MAAAWNGPGAQPDLRSVLDALWRRRWLFLGILVSIPVVVYVVSTRLVDTYQTHAIISSSAHDVRGGGGTGGALSSFGSEELLVDSQKVQDAGGRGAGRVPRGSVKVAAHDLRGNDTNSFR